MGFPVPFGMLDARAHGTTSRATSCSTGAAASAASSSRAAVERLHRDACRGPADGGDAIWSLLNLELWYRTFIDGDGVQTLPAPDIAGRGLRAADLHHSHVDGVHRS